MVSVSGLCIYKYSSVCCFVSLLTCAFSYCMPKLCRFVEHLFSLGSLQNVGTCPVGQQMTRNCRTFGESNCSEVRTGRFARCVPVNSNSLHGDETRDASWCEPCRPRVAFLQHASCESSSSFKFSCQCVKCHVDHGCDFRLLVSSGKLPQHLKLLKISFLTLSRIVVIVVVESGKNSWIQSLRTFDFAKSFFLDLLRTPQWGDIYSYCICNF